MSNLPSAYADGPRLQSVAAVLKITLEAANQAFAQYVPRDAIEADMVEQILLTRARIAASTARVLAPDIAPAVAARIDRTINTMTRELRTLLERLELRQNRPTWNLPQQYWRADPIREVGPVMEENSPPTLLQPEQTAPPPAVQPQIVLTGPRWTDPEGVAGDTLARFAAMRLAPDQSAEEAWDRAARAEPPPIPPNKLSRPQERHRRSA